VIEQINGDLVAVWINVRTTPLPRLSIIPDVLVNARVDGDNKIVDPFSEGFFLRSVVLTPDGGTILNPSPKTVGKSIARAMFEGDNSYAAIDAGDYLSMLRRSLRRFRAPRGSM
jgi:hypothetical protein